MTKTCEIAMGPDKIWFDHEIQITECPSNALDTNEILYDLRLISIDSILAPLIL